jgi:tRNA pseudouridine55 synthase
MNGALLVHKHQGVSSFGIIELLQKPLYESGLKRKDLPKFGHGGTLDPFATGLLIVLVGKGVKLARYFLGSQKVYEGTIRFGETTIPGDPTAPISETSSHIPGSIEEVQTEAVRFCQEPYFQVPPMHSAKKVNGKPLYELARQGIEIEREPKLCQIGPFEILSYNSPHAQFRVHCSSGTYVRTLAKDLAKKLGTVALLDTLHRTSSGTFSIQNAWTVEQIVAAGSQGQKWDQLPCWVPFDHLLQGYAKVAATPEEKTALLQGQQHILPGILSRASLDSTQKEDRIGIYCSDQLIAVAAKFDHLWGIERVFT